MLQLRTLNKKYISVLIFILIGCILFFTSCRNLLIADNNDTNSNGKYEVAIIGGDKNNMADRIYFCLIIDIKTGNIISKTKYTPYNLD